MNKNIKLLVSVSSLVMLACAGLQGCGSDSDSGPTAGAAGKGLAGAAGEAGAAGTASIGEAGAGGTSSSGGGAAGEGGSGDLFAGAGGEGGAVELTQAELCTKFCADELTTCTAALYPYADNAACLTACNGYARGEVGDTAGNTLDCRIYHLNAAATVNATAHCPHTGATPTAFCVDASK